jgi:hypothetical protein
MPTELYLVLSFALGCAVTWLWMTANSRWQRAKGLIKQPDVVTVENTKRRSEATQKRSQGCREMLRALLEIVILLLLTFLAALFFSGFLR